MGEFKKYLYDFNGQEIGVQWYNPETNQTTIHLLKRNDVHVLSGINCQKYKTPRETLDASYGADSGPGWFQESQGSIEDGDTIGLDTRPPDPNVSLPPPVNIAEFIGGGLVQDTEHPEWGWGEVAGIEGRTVIARFTTRKNVHLVLYSDGHRDITQLKRKEGRRKGPPPSPPPFEIGDAVLEVTRKAIADGRYGDATLGEVVACRHANDDPAQNIVQIVVEIEGEHCFFDGDGYNRAYETRIVHGSTASGLTWDPPRVKSDAADDLVVESTGEGISLLTPAATEKAPAKNEPDILAITRGFCK
jgi:hypothetical protein